jgi:uncharacterized protein YceK
MLTATMRATDWPKETSMARPRPKLATAVAAAVLVVSGCGSSSQTGTPSPGTPTTAASSTFKPAASTAEKATPGSTQSAATDVQALVWAEIIDLPQDVGGFTIQPQPLSPKVLSVLRDGLEVGQVFSRAYSDVALAGVGADQGGTADGLLPFAVAYVEHIQALTNQERPDATFAAVAPTEFAFVNGHGVRLGWSVDDGGQVVERFAIYLVQLPGGIEWIQAGFDPGDIDQAGFPKDKDLAEFLPLLAQVMANAKVPVTD